MRTHTAYPQVRCVLFDLDGTLVDTAPDLGAALNRTRVEDGLPALALAQLRPVTSQGVRGLLREGYGIGPDDVRYATLADRVLAHYTDNICVDSALFTDMPALLARLGVQGLSWGIVTNKHTRFTTPLVAALGLPQSPSCVVSGDTTPKAKPAPEPLLYAAAACGVTPGECVYLGDDERDIIAARAAGMASFAVRWGYIGTDKPIEDWGADHIIDHPLELMDYLPPAA
ncbi:HAD-IA family hydrolase [Uliginosibacterium sp. H3]|uniref:HAD-IA family hydrolase n=1 Tax=Uliginosibacterium silvisoli TaxID=3114758 RepID=A0ABU6KAE9_9RHOO|nr:HAD-IA family hydrolase [Uliginosibacterium sp. H3]